MINISPELQAYRDERARLRQGQRSPRIVGRSGGWLGVVDRRAGRSLNAFVGWADSIRSMPADNKRLR